LSEVFLLLGFIQSLVRKQHVIEWYQVPAINIHIKDIFFCRNLIS